MTGDPYWWQKVECHLNPMWRLPDLDQYMLDTIKDTYRFEFNLKILPDFMTIERLLFAAWIELSQRSSEEALNKAANLVQQADSYRIHKYDTSDNAFIGYGIIIYAFLMWIYHKSGSTREFQETENKLKELWDKASFQSDSNSLDRSYQIFIDVTHAWTLGRLGSEKRCKALRLLDKALTVRNKKHGNEQWLFTKALIQSKAAREGICFDNLQRNTFPNRLKILKKEKDTLEQVAGKHKPRFDLAKAHLGTVMTVLDNTDKNAKTALRLIKESLPDDGEDEEVAPILARLNEDINKTKMLQDILQYCETEANVARENRPSDVYFQLGLLYCKQSELQDETRMVDKGLSMVQKAVNRDMNNIQARICEAMILADLHNQDPRNSERAKEIYFEILQAKYSNTATELHRLRSISSDSVRSIYEPLQYLQNIFQFLLFCIKHHLVKNYLGAFDFDSVVRKDAYQRMEVLQKQIESDFGDKKIKHGAIQYLAEVNLHLERYAKAEDMINKLKSEVYSPNKLETKVKCGLAKCFYRLGKFQELKSLGEVYDEGDGDTTRKNMKEIQGLITLAEGKEKQNEMMAKCEDAIDLGSLDGCLLMLNMYQHFQEKFFAFRERFAHRLAKVKLCSMREVESEIQQASNQGRNNKNKVKQNIDEKINAIIMYCRSRTVVHESHESAYKKVKESVVKKLTEIRSLLLDFEYYLLFNSYPCSTKEGFLECVDRQCSNAKQQLLPETTSIWRDDCRKAAEDVLIKVRFLLDEVISCLQIAVLGQKHSRSEFPIIADWKVGHQNKEKADEQLQTRLSNLFTGKYELFIPELIFDCLLKIQPMFDEENDWLLLLSHTVNQMKHSGLELGPVCKYFHTDGTFHLQLCTSYVVRRSCEEVEKIAHFLLDKCAEMM